MLGTQLNWLTAVLHVLVSCAARSSGSPVERMPRTCALRNAELDGQLPVSQLCCCHHRVLELSLLQLVLMQPGYQPWHCGMLQDGLACCCCSLGRTCAARYASGSALSHIGIETCYASTLFAAVTSSCGTAFRQGTAHCCRQQVGQARACAFQVRSIVALDQFDVDEAVSRSLKRLEQPCLPAAAAAVAW